MKRTFKAQGDFEKYLHDVVKKNGEVRIGDLVNPSNDNGLRIDKETKVQLWSLYGKEGEVKIANLIAEIFDENRDKYTCVSSPSQNKGDWVFKVAEAKTGQIVELLSSVESFHGNKLEGEMQAGVCLTQPGEIDDELPVVDDSAAVDPEPKPNNLPVLCPKLRETIESNMVQIADFCISKYVVTQNIYEKVMGSNPSSFKDKIKDGEQWDGLPVENVSVQDAMDFCNELSKQCGYEPCYSEGELDATKNGFRLPLVKEWNYVANGGADSPRHKYAGDDNHNAVAWYQINSGNRTHRVTEGMLGVKINSDEVVGLNGNVWEWCWSQDNAKEAVCYGGSYQDSEKVLELGSALNRKTFDRQTKRSSIGFRIAVNSLNKQYLDD